MPTTIFKDTVVLNFADMRTLLHRRPFFHHFQIRQAPYNLLHGATTKVNQPSLKINWMKNSYCSLVSRLWNRVPDEVRNAENLHMFLKNS